MKIDWRRTLIEGVVIVASILMALGIQAWWDERQLRQEERRLLINLQVDFVATRSAIAEAAENHREVRDRAVALAEYGLSGGSLPVPDFYVQEPALLPNLFTIVITVHPKTGALDGALASGRLDLITDDTLRSMLAGWPRTLGEFMEQQTWLWNLAQEARPVLSASVPIADRVLAARILRLSGRETVDDVSPEWIAFLTSASGQNLTALRAHFEGLYVEDAEQLLFFIDELLRLLDQQVTRG